MKRKPLLLATGVVACGVALVVAGATAESKPASPPNPPWVRSNGTVDTTYRVPVVDSTGALVVDASGRPFTVPLLPPLPAVPGAATPAATSGPEVPAPPTTITVDANGAGQGGYAQPPR